MDDANRAEHVTTPDLAPPAPGTASRREASDISLWSLAQRRAILVLLTLILLYAGVELRRHPTTIDDPQPPRGGRADELSDALDPNNADAATLSAIPSLGEKRARAIVAYRDAHRRADGRPVFATPLDLSRVAGIGATTAGNLAPYLRFPLPTTRRSR